MAFYQEQHLLEFFLTIMKISTTGRGKNFFFTDPINSSIHKFHDSMSLAQIIDPVSFINIAIAVNINKREKYKIATFSPICIRIDSYVSSPNNIHTISRKQGSKNTQIYQVEVVFLI